jgi:hypothetical protein
MNRDSTTGYFLATLRVAPEKKHIHALPLLLRASYTPPASASRSRTTQIISAGRRILMEKTMSTKNTMKKLIAAAMAAAGIIGVVIAQERSNPGNQVNQNLTPIPNSQCKRDCDYLGAVGLTRGLTARLNAYDKSVVDNPVDVSPQSRVNDVPPGPCRAVELMFIDSMGNIRQRSTQCLLPGHAVFLDFNGNFLEVPGMRAEIRGLVRFVEDPNLFGPNSIKLGATLEVFDNETGRTSFVLLPAVQNTWAGR